MLPAPYTRTAPTYVRWRTWSEHNDAANRASIPGMLMYGVNEDTI
jgi:hypothetical protein